MSKKKSLASYSSGDRKGNWSDKVYCSNGRNVSIVDSREGDECIVDLNEKDFFVFRGDLYMVLRDLFTSDNGNYYALSLTTLDVCEFRDSTMVEPVYVRVEIMN